MSVVSATVCNLPMQIVSDRDRRRRRLFQIIWKPRLKTPVISKSNSDNYRPISVSLPVYTLFYKNNFMKTKRLKFARELRTS